MQDRPRKHHFVPSFYLAGFTDTGDEHGKIHVFKKADLRTRPSTPKETAFERDFYTLQTRSGDPFAIERRLSTEETRWGLVLSSIVKSGRLPEDDNGITDLLSFISFSAVRVRPIRNKVHEFIDGANRRSQRAVELLLEKGESAQAQLADNSRSWHVTNMVEMAVAVMPFIFDRTWTLLTLRDDAPDLICSDCPVCLAWLTPWCYMRSPGFGDPHTIITMPLHRRFAIIGTWGIGLTMTSFGRLEVANFNLKTSLFANELYSSYEDFVCTKPDGRVGNKADLVAELRERRQ